jgi:hypothetical protein
MIHAVDVINFIDDESFTGILPSLKETTLTLLQNYYGISSNDIPESTCKSLWKGPNKLGFLKRIIKHGHSQDVQTVHDLLKANEFKEKEKDIIDSLYTYYIYPYKSHNGSNRCQTPDSSTPPLYHPVRIHWMNKSSFPKK